MSTGPRTAAGKERSRLNALAHGLRAEALVVLPHEDPEAYRARVDAYLADFRPRSSVEADLVLHAADLSWRLERVSRYERLSLSGRVEGAMARASRARRDRFEEDWRKLLPEVAEEQIQIRLAPESAAWLRDRVEATAEGCSRLLAVWRTLREAAASSTPWTLGQELHAIRMMGHGPRPLTDPEVLDMVVANRYLNRPSYHHGDGVTLLDGELMIYFGAAAAKEARERCPRNSAEAFPVLVAAADRAIARLEGLLAARATEAPDDSRDAEAAEIAGILASFDGSDEGERLRRYQMALHRELLRTIAAIAKLRREDAKRDREADEQIGDEIGDGDEQIRDGAAIPADPPDPATKNAPNEPIVQAALTFDAPRSPQTGAASVKDQPDEPGRLRKRRREAMLRRFEQSKRPRKGR